MDSELLQTIGSLGTATATIALVFILYKAIKQMESTVKLTQIQTEYQFRPWIGPSARFQRIEPSINDLIQFEVTIKNFGELPASGVDAKFLSSDKLIDRHTLISLPETVFALGPMLPNMEKRYWFFIEKQRWKNVESGKESLFTGVYFQYVANSQQNGYGIISQYISLSQSFVHKDMWIDNPGSTLL